MMENYVIVDLETTGLSPAEDKIIEIGAIKIRAGRDAQVYNAFVNPEIPISRKIQEITGITDEMVREAAKIEDIIGDFVEFTEDLPLLGHNLRFDYGFLKTAAAAQKISFEKDGVDTLAIARKYLSGLESRRLDILCEYFGIAEDRHHRAWNDAKVTGELYRILWEKFGQEPQAETDFLPKKMVFAVKKASPITAKQESFLKSLLLQHGITPDYEIEKLTKSEASKKIDGIISQFGRY